MSEPIKLPPMPEPKFIKKGDIPSISLLEHKYLMAELKAACTQTYAIEAALQSQDREDAQPKLKVVVCSFPESNGKRNWTALLLREQPWEGLAGNCGGITLAYGELWNRVAYEAECTKFLLGMRDTEPCILDYGVDIETPEQWLGEAIDRARRIEGDA